MREIKFRVWQTLTKKMLDHDWLLAAGTVYEAVFNPKEYNKVMQFTGVKDKRETPIFEGDMVETEGWKHMGEFPSAVLLTHIDREKDNTIDVVVFYAGMFGVIPKNEKRDGSFIPLAYFSDACEVIGNIHENPELLRP
jgi:uncharacterized phage protein (TIGR01671 family)